MVSEMYPQNDWRSYIAHSAKGQKWKTHKYVAIRNDRYIYPENVHGGGKSSTKLAGLAYVLEAKQSYDQGQRGGSGRYGLNYENRYGPHVKKKGNNSKVKRIISDWSDRKREQGAPLWKIMDKLTKRGKKK